MAAVLLYVIAMASLGLALPKPENNYFPETNYADVTNTSGETTDQQAEIKIAELSQVTEKGRKIPAEVNSEFHCAAGKAGVECRKAKRKQRLMQANIGLLDRIDAYELKKRTCQFGEYYDNGKNTCERCASRCNEGDLTACGLECRGYFQVWRLREEMRLGDEKLRNKNEGLLTRTNVCIGVAAAGLFLTGYSMLTMCKNRRKMKVLKKKLREIQRRNYGIAACDEQDDDKNCGGSSKVISGKKTGSRKIFCCGKSKAVCV